MIKENRFFLRNRRLIWQIIKKLKLNLNGLIILTEAASGNYIFTPLIAAMAGAKKVYALTRNSRYAQAKDVIKDTFKFADYLKIKNKIEIITKLPPKIISKADIITNTGFLRPINKNFISHIKPTAVIPLMFESWEFRPDDLDLEECHRRDIPVLGTNENNNRLKIFEYLGALCAKKLFEANIEILDSKIVVMGRGIFGLNIAKKLAGMGARINIIYNKINNKIETRGFNNGKISKKITTGEALKNSDAIITTTYLQPHLIIGNNGWLSAQKIKKYCPEVLILQLAGRIDRYFLDKYNLAYLPKIDPGNHMAWTLAELGPKPAIDLHAGGLKVGELMARLRLEGFSYQETIQKALKNEICQKFNKKKLIIKK